VTFLLTDVEASTSQWGADADAMADAIRRHYELLDAVVRDHDGVRPVEQGEGDSIVAAFARPSDALHCALEAQRQLGAEPWPTTAPLRVRMALHTGEGRLRDERNYAGNAIIRTARLRAIAHGGQVVVSSATRDLAVDELAGDIALVDLGVHRLKDLERPERVWQLVHADIETDFPPLRSLDAVPNNLPVALSSFVGRFDAIDTVARLVFDNRLVTLTGSGGAGKTRLAQQVAAEVLDAFPDGVWWVDLVDVNDPELVPSAISRAAMLPEDRADRLGGLGRRLGARRTLVVLDNCEHLPDACAVAATAVLSATTATTVLATSRSPLNVPGELSWQVPPMGLPPASGTTDPDDVARADAVRLFVDRAARVQHGFTVTEANAADVAEICRRLDGIPLAIELAAARTRVLTPAEIRAGLADAIGLLGGTQRGVAARHRTIEASIRWSHALLDPDEQVLLRRLAVFAGAFTLDAARAVAADERLPAGSVLAVLESLVDQSLVRREEHDGPARFGLLVTVRQFARSELEAAGEAGALAERHAAYFAARARGLWPLFEENMSELLDRAEAEFADLADMLSWLEHHAPVEEHVEVAMACLPAMAVRHAAEATALGDRVVPRVDALSSLGGHLHFRLALVDPTGPDHIATGVAAAEATGDPELVAQAGFWAGWLAAYADPTRDAIAALRAGQATLAEHGEGHFSRGYWTVGGIERVIGHHAEAVRDAELGHAHTICKRCNVVVWSDTALLALADGNVDGARDALARAWGFGREVRDAGFLAYVRLTEAEIAAFAGTPFDRTGIARDLADAAASGHPMVLGYTSEASALARIVDGDLGEATTELARVIPAVEERWPKRTETRLRQAMVAHALGDLDTATALVDELREIAVRANAGDWLLTQIDHRAAALALDAGEVTVADDLAHRALAAAASRPFPALVVQALELIAAVAVQRESYVEGARLTGAASGLRDAFGFRFDPQPEHGRTEQARAEACTALGDAAFDAAVGEGRALTLEEAVAYAQRARGERRRPSYGWDGLTPTERQVADLAIQGLTNAQIADRLFVGRETVKTHLSNVYAKVGVANRTQLVADAARRGITS
jgi:predicted ATPase/class 3 adenylate cyclase/DNA-binding CsgD family transcriptional regulator